MKRTWLIIIACTVILITAGITQFLFPRTAVSPSTSVPELPVVENNIATSTNTKLNPIQVTAHVSSSTTKTTPVLPSIAKGDIIVSWDFKGAYADNPELIAKADAEIKRLSDLIGKDTYPDLTIYVSIAIQYDLLGDGKKEYDSLVSAIKADSSSGLPWHNLGVLMEKLGALKTARFAYDRAVLLQPQFKEIQEP